MDASTRAVEPGFDEDGPLYTAGKTIYPQSVKGTFRTIKWIVLAITLGIYYFLPFVRWDRGSGAPDQAVLIDFPARRFYFFFIEIWPQEVYYLTGLLIIAAMALFLMNALAGRVWCGYLCPQTVWTDLFYATERFFEGDRRARMRAEAQGWTASRLARRGAKLFVWLMIAWWTGGAWVLYFADAPTLVKELATGQAPFIAYASIGTLTFTTFALAGFMREQVCIYMCPWPRIQAALTDEYALNVTYRYDRGEPRHSVKKAESLRAQGLPAGDCVDCGQCVAVCPTGIDIRNGLQIDCIQCGLCIDACDAVMKKVGRPARLIAYDTDLNIQNRLAGKPVSVKLIRSRTVLYAAIIAIVGLVMVYALATRHDMAIKAIHDRNPIAVQLSDGSIRNGYALHLTNKTGQPRTYALAVDGVPRARIDVVGVPAAAEGRVLIEIGPDQTREVRALVVSDAPMERRGARRIVFGVVDAATGAEATTTDHFRAP